MGASDRDLKAGAGCLIAVGSLGMVLVLLLLVGPIVLGLFSGSIFTALGSIQFSSYRAFVISIRRALSLEASAGIYSSIAYLCGTVYVVLFWQWCAFLGGSRLLVEPRRLWALSSAFFAGIVLLLVWFGYELMLDFKSRGGDIDTPTLLTWMTLSCLFPGAFLSITVQLWLSTSRKTKAASGTPNRKS